MLEEFLPKFNHHGKKAVAASSESFPAVQITFGQRSTNFFYAYKW